MKIPILVSQTLIIVWDTISEIKAQDEKSVNIFSDACVLFVESYKVTL